MIEVPATDFVRNFGRYRDAAQRRAVRVKAHDRVAGYFVSAHDFDEYQDLKARAGRWSLAVEALDDEAMAAIAASRMDSRHDHLNALLDDAE